MASTTTSSTGGTTTTTTTTTTSTTSTNTKSNFFSYEPSKFVSAYESLRQEIRDGSIATHTETVTTPLDERNSKSNKNKIVVAAVQMETMPSSNNSSSSSSSSSSRRSSSISSSSSSSHAKDFFNRAIEAIEKAVTNHGANLVVLQELFMGPYFCQSQEASMFALAESNIEDNNAFIDIMRDVAKQFKIVLPISIFEQKNNTFYNSVVMIDSDGEILGTYRKTHIPDGTGYQEKFYFSPGDTGFKVFPTKIGNVGVGICWDQWFPEAARSMALQGADILLYPTAIGSEPQDPSLDSSDHWQRVMQGHAAANMIPVVASNRYGTEILLDSDGKEKQRIHFYGRSFITSETGAILKEAADGSDIISVEIDAVANRSTRAAWGLFRDRRPEMYDTLRTKDGHLLM